jgi:hypothetical protein
VSEFLFDNPYLSLFFSGDEPTDTPTPDPVTTLPTDPKTPPTEQDNAMVKLGDVYHVQWPTMKHVENSPSGIDHAARLHMSIDLDMQLDKDGVIWCTHWERPMEKDGFRHPSLPKTTPMNRMNAAQIQQLHTKDGYHIHTMEDMLRYAASKGVKVRAEPKPDKRWTVEKFRELRGYQTAAGAKVVIATQDNDPNWRDRLDNARKAGFPDVRRLRG